MKYISSKRVILHISYWILFIFCYPLFFNALVTGNLDAYYLQLLGLAITCIYLVPVSYLIAYYLIPQFLINNKKVLLFLIYYLSLSISILIVDFLVNVYYFSPKYQPNLCVSLWSYTLSTANVIKQFFILQSQLFIFLAFSFFIQYVHNYLEKEKLKHKIVEKELNMLKGQIHPHFLFNTLNNIYTMSLDCSNSSLSESVAKMSDILRFSLYECNTLLIPVSKEIKVIKDYIYLEKLRYSDIKIDFSAPNNLDEVYIAPLVLFPFIENAFKHGTSKTAQNKWINITLFIENKRLHFNVKNSKQPSYNKSISTSFYNYSKGIGIANTTKRLKIFYGRNDYKIDINNHNTFFEIDLYINLDTNVDKAII